MPTLCSNQAARRDHDADGLLTSGPPGVAPAGFAIDIKVGGWHDGGRPDRQPPFIRTWGTWLPGEFSQHRHRDLELVILGHCLLSPARREAGLGTAAAHGDLDQVARWPGSYTAILLRPGGLTAYGDLAGQFPLYYAERDGVLLVSSDCAAIAARRGQQPDPVTAAIRIACPDVLPMWSSRSPYAGVSRLPGGGVLRAAPGSVRADAGQPPLPGAGQTRRGGAELLRAALADGVRARCADADVSADFSGGLDSTSVAFLAAGCRRAAVPSIAYHQPLAPAADLAAAERLAALDPRIALTVVRGTAATLPFAGLTEPMAAAALTAGAALASSLPGAADDEPAPGMLAASRSGLRLAAAAAAGSRLHLTGEGGDAILMAAPSYLASLASPGSARTLLRHCGAYARLRYLSPARLAWSAARLSRTTAARALRELAAGLERGGSRPAGWAGQIAWWAPAGETAGWLTAAARRRLAEIAGDPATARAVPAGAGPADLAALTDVRRSADAQRHLRGLARPLGLAVHAPFLDSAVIRAALSVPAPDRADPWSYKPLLRAAVDGLVPGAVLARRTKGDYSAEDYQGARLAAGELRALLRDSRLADLGVIEPGAVRAALDRMTAGVSAPAGGLTTVLATEAWLRAAGHPGERGLLAC